MNVTTKWSFRKKHLHAYRVNHFANDWDYFIYLHLNSATRQMHLLGTLIGLSLFPWACYHFFHSWSLWPTVVYVFFYYGFGFISHFLFDGQISETWRQLMKTYKYAVRMNIMVLFGRFQKEEDRFKTLYPETLWVYQANNEELHF